MDITKLGELVSEFTPLVLIVDHNGLILWASEKLEEEFNFNYSKENKFEDLFNFIIQDIDSEEGYKANINGKTYLIKNKIVDDEKRKLNFILFKDICSYNDKEIKSYCLEKIIEKVDDGIMMSDYKGKVVIYNNAMEKLEDRRSSDMIGKFLWDAYGYKDEDKSEHRKVFKTGQAIKNKYQAHAYNNGKPKYVLYSTYPIVKDENKIGVFSISKNETKLHSLLSETTELKRRFNRENQKEAKKNYKSNGTTFTFSDIVGSSETMLNLIKQAQSIAWLENNILIVGDTGTGKEVFAQSIHNYGKRYNEPFIGINCSAIPENLLESILFGTAKGAFTGALDHSGLFEEAGEGTLFLDELNSMPLSMQSKLLRVLQERRARRVGGSNSIPIKCRIISAMNENPMVLIEKGKFREDLFYRIAGFTLYIPPIYERKKDILELSKFFISKYNGLMNRNVVGITRELKKVMTAYIWPGNVRELEHFIENIMVGTEENDRYLRISNIPEYLKEAIIGSNAMDSIIEKKESLPETLDNIEKKIIIERLEKNNWNISRTSKELGIIRQSLNYRMKRLGIEKKIGG